MRLILSRKGFDSGSGGCPSPILPDGRLYSLPIPDKTSGIAYRDLYINKYNMADIICALTGDSRRQRHFAHLDPDLVHSTLPRQSGWRPVLGQMNQAEGHLRKQYVSTDDLFLFFGLFQEVEQSNNRWRFVPHSRPKHILWGWLQVEKIIDVNTLKPSELEWARYHPHFNKPDAKNNTLYIAQDHLTLSNLDKRVSGAGVFPLITPEIILTAPDSLKVSEWRLPKEFFPGESRTPLSYHQNLSRWTLLPDHCRLTAASRGQEFVLNLEEYPSVKKWATELIEGHSKSANRGS